MRVIASWIFVAVLTAAAAVGQITFPYSEWMDGPVRHLATPEERSGWNALRSNDEAKAFIDLFWARRDPTPATPRNEFHEEFNARVDLADRTFPSTKMRGAMSDPGRVLILLGPPYQVSGRGGSASISSMTGGMSIPTDTEGNVFVPSPRGEQPRQVWTYAHNRKPRFIQQDRIVLVFVDEGLNEWQLAHTERTNPNLILAQAVSALIISPGLTQPPVFKAPVHAREFKSEVLRKSYEVFQSGGRATLGAAHLTLGEFLSVDGEPYIAVQLYAPAGSGIEAGRKMTLFAVVKSSSGEIVDIEEQSATIAASAQDGYAGTTLRLDPGDYTASFGLADGDGRIVAIRSASLTVAPLDPIASAVSPLLLSADIHPVKAVTADPFVFGGLKVVPKGDLVFPTKGDLWYFVEMRNPGLGEQGKPSVVTQAHITGQTAKGPAEMTVPPGPASVTPLGTPGRYAVGLAIPLEGFIPGDYKMELRLVDSVLAKTYKLEKDFRVEAP